MNIAVIGLGSMGKRRIRLIRELYPEYNIVGVDGRSERCEEAVNKYNIDCYAKLDDIEKRIDSAFVCTSPLSHSTIIKEALESGYNVFTEINLVDDGYEENIKLAKDNHLVLFLSSTFLYRAEINYIQKKVLGTKKWNYIYHIGQYLPDWHPWESYKDFFLGDKRTNGCREILAIELPWIIETFGEASSVKASSSKMTELEIDYDDNYMIQITHKNGNKGSLIVDVVSPVAVRKFETYTENEYLSWGGTPDSLYEFNKKNNILKLVDLKEEVEHIEGYSDFVVENAYKNEIKEFFNVVLNNKVPLYSFEKDMTTLKIIDTIGA